NYLLVTTETDVEHYSARTKTGLRGLYADSRVLTDVSQVEAIVDNGARDTHYTLALFQTGKVEYASQVAIAEQLKKRYGGYSHSTADAMILFLGAKSGAI